MKKRNLFIIVFLISIFFVMPGVGKADTTVTQSNTLLVCSYYYELSIGNANDQISCNTNHNYYGNGCALEYTQDECSEYTFDAQYSKHYRKVNIYYNIDDDTWKVEYFIYGGSGNACYNGKTAFKEKGYKNFSTVFSTSDGWNIYAPVSENTSAFIKLESFSCSDYVISNEGQSTFKLCFTDDGTWHTDEGIVSDKDNQCSTSINKPKYRLSLTTSLDIKLAVYNADKIGTFKTAYYQWLNSDGVTSESTYEDFAKYLVDVAGFNVEIAGKSGIEGYLINYYANERLYISLDDNTNSNLIAKFSEYAEEFMQLILSELQDGTWNENYNNTYNSQAEVVGDERYYTTTGSAASQIMDESEEVDLEDFLASAGFEVSKMTVEPIEECSTLLGSPIYNASLDTQEPAYYIVFAFKVIRYVAIILLVVLTIMDFVGPIASQDQDAVKKAINKAIKRLVLCIVIWLLPSILTIVLQWFDEIGVGTDCLTNF